MERLTKCGYQFSLLNVLQGLTRYTEIDEILNQLAAYEDTGLSPADIPALTARAEKAEAAEEENEGLKNILRFNMVQVHGERMTVLDALSSLTARAEAAEAERDAAVADMHGYCKACINAPKTLDYDDLIKPICRECNKVIKQNWQWRGPQEGGEGETE